MRPIHKPKPETGEDQFFVTQPGASGGGTGHCNSRRSGTALNLKRNLDVLIGDNISYSVINLSGPA